MTKRRLASANSVSAITSSDPKTGQRGKYPQEVKEEWVKLAQEGRFISQIGEASELPKSEWQNIRNHLKAMGIEVARERAERRSSAPPAPRSQLTSSSLATLIANAEPSELEAELESLKEQRQRLDRAIKAIEMLLNG